VPRSWPVYDLGRDPSTCVRFDRHAVYLGSPGANQACPAHLIGRTETIALQPYSDDQVTEDSELVQLRSHGVLITASYGAGGPGAVRSMLPAGAAAVAQPTSAPPVTPTGTPTVTQGAGFDACAAPSRAAMRAWSRSSAPYQAVGIYIGGLNRGCPYGHLSAAWVGAVRGYGYHFIPTYVGRQAPCSKVGTKISTNPTQATKNGHDAAVNAIHLMQHFGFGAHTPVYLDLEQYDRGNAACTRSVQRFLDAWVKRLHPSGYLGGVYMSSTDTPDLVAARKISGFHLPDAVWFVRWNGRASVYRESTIPDNFWAPHKRAHQYRGPHDASNGGVRMNIDSDYLDGPVA